MKIKTAEHKTFSNGIDKGTFKRREYNKRGKFIISEQKEDKLSNIMGKYNRLSYSFGVF